MRQKSRAYFQNLYREDGGQRPRLDDIFFKQISAASRVRAINSTLLVITPKIAGANDIKDFRPISLVGSLYKLIVKV